MLKLIQLNIRGIKCDKFRCGYQDNTVLIEEYRQWLNRPCPSCGSNLLTEKDHKSVRRILNSVFWINLLLWPIALYVNTRKNAKIMTMPIFMNGTGEVNVGDIVETKPNEKS